MVRNYLAIRFASWNQNDCGTLLITSNNEINTKAIEKIVDELESIKDFEIEELEAEIKKHGYNVFRINAITVIGDVYSELYSDD